ncbi:MBL fold metallo-hydrolase [Edaphobacter modestus]|uniref:L-ascorbate metabolism protein UlaG (Beta-lactamase superfamily) n=1 Tax=Edaphobacter modestus TaxID=388466 RepID=A0A4V6MFS6_9BACT|nr:MBL fold metallo-hydrolase [Edaphobacter modestus]RZU39046.1 L-ascorbate metabolism protein UlaG (beta-lactamase superfamily) [Edaphobacter modestus]
MESVDPKEAEEAKSLLRRAIFEERRFLNPLPTSVGGWETMRKALPLYLNNKEEKSPRRPLGPFRTDAGVYATPPASGLRLTWMGHSSTLVEMDGMRVLLDPVWDERASPLRWAGPKRFFAAPLKLKEMPSLDVVVVSHDHYDHLGESTIRTLAGMAAMRETEWVTALGVGEILEEYGVKRRRITELDWTESLGDASLSITALPSRHFSGRSMFNRFGTLWSSFALKGPVHNVYYGADSGWWPGFAEIGSVYGPFDVTMLEIGAYNELWKDIHLGPEGAVQAFEALGGKGLLMPIHWGLFDLALHGWKQPIEQVCEIADEKGIALWVPQPGLPTEVVRDTAVRSEWWR